VLLDQYTESNDADEGKESEQTPEQRFKTGMRW